MTTESHKLSLSMCVDLCIYLSDWIMGSLYFQSHSRIPTCFPFSVTNPRPDCFLSWRQWKHPSRFHLKEVGNVSQNSHFEKTAFMGADSNFIPLKRHGYRSRDHCHGQPYPKQALTYRDNCAVRWCWSLLQRTGRKHGQRMSWALSWLWDVLPAPTLMHKNRVWLTWHPFAPPSSWARGSKI